MGCRRTVPAQPRRQAWAGWQRILPVAGDWTHGQKLTLGLPWLALIVVEGTGILIYVSLFERMVCVLGDEPITRRLDQKSRDRVKDLLTAGMRRKKAGEAFCQAIACCGDLLAQHFPHREGDANELPNELRILS